MIDVCLVTKYFYPSLAGGADRFRNYAPGLRERGVLLRVVTVLEPGTATQEVVDGIPVHRVSMDKDVQDVGALLLRKAMKSFQEHNRWPEILHFLSHSIRGVPDVWRAKFLGIPCMITFTMMPTEHQGIGNKLKNLVFQWIRCHPFDRIITSSTVMAQRVRKLRYPARYLEIIPHGVDIKRFRPVSSLLERNRIREQLGWGLDDEIVLFVGGILPRKGVDLLLSAWLNVIRQRPNAKLVLIGPRHKNMPTLQSFNNRIDELLLNVIPSERMMFAGIVKNVEAYMQAADVFVLPSRREGMSNAVAEAMATGLPCILTPHDGLPAEFGQPGREYLLVPHNSDALAATMLEVMESNNCRGEIGRAARIWVERHLDVEKSLDRYAITYRELTAKRHKVR